MKLKSLIEVLLRFDPEMDVDGMSVTSKGKIRPYLQESSIFTGISAFWGAFLGVLALGAAINILNNL